MLEQQQVKGPYYKQKSRYKVPKSFSIRRRYSVFTPSVPLGLRSVFTYVLFVSESKEHDTVSELSTESLQ